jgi:hypothetical protein
MIKRQSEISMYVDTMIVESLLSDPRMIKNSSESMVGSLVDSVKSYFGNHINPEDKAGSYLNMIAPGTIAVIFSALGKGWLGTLIGLAINIFHIDVNGILSSVYNKIKDVLGSGELMSSSKVDDIVSGALDMFNKPATEDDLKSLPDKVSNSDLRFVKIAMISYDAIIKKADPSSFDKIKSDFSQLFSKYSNKKRTIASLLGRVLGLFFKVSLASAGLMVAGDLINKMLGRSNGLDGSMKDGKSLLSDKPLIDKPVKIDAPVSTQTKFKVNPSYRSDLHDEDWIESYQNTDAGIESMLLTFAKEVYPDLKGLDSVIKSTSNFNKIVDMIKFYNHASAGNSIVYIPRIFKTKKAIVDYFIDDVAGKIK